MADTGHDQTENSQALLRELAAAHRVGTAFQGWDGAEREVSDATLRSVLGALGVSTDTDDGLRRAIHDVELAPWRRILPPVVVVREAQEFHVEVHVPKGKAVRVSITSEDGLHHDVLQKDDWEEPRLIDGIPTIRATFAIPEYLPLGWHTLHADVEGTTAECALVVTPQSLQTNADLAANRSWGLLAQLYSVRSSRSWGIGDFTDLSDLAAIAGGDGAGFILVNPLHAAEPRTPIEDSPYLPTSRRFFNPLYIRVEDVPEYAYLEPGSRSHVEKFAAQLYPANQASDRLDRNSSYGAKLAALELIFDVERSPARSRQFEKFRADQGTGLADFALWCALAERLHPSAPEWRSEAASPSTAYSNEQRELLADRVEFHSWLQWICDQQLESAQRAAKQSGMALGVIHDLAVGVKTNGADAWMLSDVLARGVTVGAPPDMFNQQGQDWSQPPWHPARLAEVGYAPYRDMLRTILRHAGGVRVDHILGLFRLWWIPQGSGPEQGAYVYYDHEALIGILALEAQRADAVVIGEDLGVFEPWVRGYLSERGIFGTSILWFEQDADGPLVPGKYRQQCLTSVNTHDLPPTAGYLAGEHVALRESLGLLRRPVEEERAEAASEQEAVLALLREYGVLQRQSRTADQQGQGQQDPALRQQEIQRIVEALYAFTVLTPSSLLGIALVDAVGETRTQNQPGTHEQYPNWCIPLAGPEGAVLIDSLDADPRYRSLVDVVKNMLQKGA
jgi:4-alpha-glucanotransferase